jgi:hypothetical protein
MNVARSVHGLAFVVALLALPAVAMAQESRGTITGTVLDSSRGVLPGATVTVTNLAMGTEVTVVTNDVGFFQAPYLLPGQYRVTAEMPGFTRLVHDRVEVRVGDRLQLEMVLEISGAAEEVTVTAATPAARHDRRLARPGGGRAPGRRAADAAR